MTEPIHFPESFSNDIFEGDYYTRRFSPGPSEDKLILNMGPQHPSTHGVLRIMVELQGEYIMRAEPVLGYIHRNQEHMGQTKMWSQYYPNMGRLDYLHALAWNWSWCGAVEKLGEVEVPERAEYLRVITTELNRIASHLMWWGAYLLDLGGVTPILYAFGDREMILDLLQIVTGSRLTYAYFRFGGVTMDATPNFLSSTKEFCKYLRGRLPMFKDLVTDNIILRKRCEEIGLIDLDMARRYGATGPVLRGSGQAYDIRRAEPYSIYDRFEFEIPTDSKCDAMSRYLVRMAEIEQSLRIIEQAIDQIPEGPFIHPKAPKARWKAPAGESYFATESARGKTGVYVLSNGDKGPYRVKLRAPGYSNLSLFAELGQGTLIADAVSILGSLDLVIPEIDR